MEDRGLAILYPRSSILDLQIRVEHIAQIESQASAHGISASAVVEDVLLERNAVKRLIEPEQVAELVGYVCGPAAWTTTGAVFSMDAGWLAH